LLGTAAAWTYNPFSLNYKECSSQDIFPTCSTIKDYPLWFCWHSGPLQISWYFWKGICL